MASDCVGYDDSFSLIVVDNTMHPIEDAAVWITFDRGTSFGDVYFTTDVQYTGADGKLDFTIHNQGTNVRDIDCNIYIKTNISGVFKEITVEANKHSDVILMEMNVYPVAIRVADHRGTLLEGAMVSIGDVTKETGADGKVEYYLPEGNWYYLISHGEGKQSGSIYVAESTFFDITLKHNQIEITIMDDYGNLLPSSIFIFNETFDVPDGVFEYEKAFGEEIPFIITYEGLEKEGDIFPEIESSIEVVYDMHAPVFGDIESAGTSEVTRLVIPIRDEGSHASGVDFDSVKVSYRLEPAEATTPWNNAVVYVSSVDTFMADFPELPKNSIVQFRIEAKDIEGNKATIDGRFSPPPPEDNGNGTTENGDGTHQNGEEQQEIPFLYIVGGVFIVLLVIILVSRIKRD
ncbi:TPA: hypothetical protein EYP38_03050 [Candidatus Micrarchaeota archaeon]|nr:hypothetical protein [Candidatus Micrarchaeota archaeon]